MRPRTRPASPSAGRRPPAGTRTGRASGRWRPGRRRRRGRRRGRRLVVVKKKVSDRVCAWFWSSHTPLILSPVNQCVSVQAAPPDVASRTVRSSSRSMLPLPSTSAASNRRFSPSADAREAGVHRPPSMDPRGWGGREGGLMGDECVCEEGETGDAACVSVGETGSWRSLSLPFSSSCRPRHRWDCDTVKGRRLVWWGGRVRAWRGCPKTRTYNQCNGGGTHKTSHTRVPSYSPTPTHTHAPWGRPLWQQWRRPGGGRECGQRSARAGWRRTGATG